MGSLKEKVLALLLLIAGLLMVKYLGVKFPYKFCIIIGFVLLATWLQDGNLKRLNFKKIGWADIRIILICYLALELLMDFVVQPLISFLLKEPADYSAFDSIRGNSVMYFSFLWKMWISAAVGEELFFRGFVFAQGRRLTGDNKIVLIILSAVLFAVPHLYQGTSGLLVTFVFGLAFAWMYARYQHIWINIIVHGLIDTVFLTLSYYGLTGFYTLSF
ncbi:MAG: CPBP family intramembrane metalloprotease [Ferruginibacter sp.]